MTQIKTRSIDAYLPLVRRLLVTSDVAGQLTPATLESLLAASTLRRWPAGSCLFVRGEAIDELHFVVEGDLEISMDSPDGRRAIVWYMGPGQWLGLIPVLDNQGAVHTARAHSDSVLLHLPSTAFMAALDTDPGLMRVCLKILCERSRRMYGSIAAESLLTLRERVARQLVLLAADHGREGEQGIELAVKMSQAELAAMLGATRQRLNHEIKALEADGVICLAYSRITVRDLPALRAIAGDNVGAIIRR